jgi:hypothetical protein
MAGCGKCNGLYYSFINIENYLTYDKELFLETLSDWGEYNIPKL